MQLHDNFSVAHLLGHPAFEHLSVAMGVYAQAQANNFFDISKHGWSDSFVIGGQIGLLRSKELKHCVQAVILFQAMMEKIPFFVPFMGAGLKETNKSEFAVSWRELLSQIQNTNDKKAASTEFEKFNTDFYKDMRNPIIHGRKEDDIKLINKINVPLVYEGMKSGWRAYDYLLTQAFKPEQKYEPSWVNMCKIHNIPDVLNLDNYPDLENVEIEYNKKHLDGARRAIGEIE